MQTTDAYRICIHIDPMDIYSFLSNHCCEFIPNALISIEKNDQTDILIPSFEHNDVGKTGCSKLSDFDELVPVAKHVKA